MSEPTMPSTSIKSQLERDGYAVLEEFLRPAECEELVAAGLELTEDAQSCPEKFIFSTIEGNKQQLTQSYFLESGDKMRFFFEPRAVGPDGTLLVDREVSLNKAGHALHLLHPIFRCYTFCDRVKAVCRQLELKEPAVVQSMYIYKNPGVGGEVVPHQDSTYLYTEPVPPVGFWIALQDATVRNGCLHVARGSHASGVHRRLLRVPVAGDRPALVYDRGPSVYPHSAFTPVPVARGSLVLLHGHVVHRSAHNESSASRHAYTFHVIEKKDNVYAASNWLQEGPAAPFLNLYDTPQTE